MDMINALPASASANSAIVEFANKLGNMTHLAACRISPRLLAHEIIRYLIRMHGLLRFALCDR